MLSFATDFPVKENDLATFVAAVSHWIQGSPHTTLDAAALGSLPSEGHWRSGTERERLEALIAERDEFAIAGFRHSISDNEIEWTTTVVFSTDSNDSWVSVRTARESNQPQLGLPPAKKPIVVRTLLSELGGGLDAELYVLDRPHYLKSNDLGMAARLLNADAGNYLPVVYISCGFDGALQVDPEPLSRSLAGMAHVLVEPDRVFSRQLQEAVGSDNVYGGRVGIYWPNGARHIYFVNDEMPTEFEVRRVLSQRLRTALLHRRPLARCTWARAEAEVARSTFEMLRASGSLDVEQYVRAFDAEITAKNRQLEEAEAEISQLRNQLRAKSGPEFGLLSLKFGSEQELHGGEFREIIGDALEAAARSAQDDGRRQHVLEAAVKNLEREGSLAEKREALKDILRNYTSMEGNTRGDLERLGFSITGEGKHYKLVYKNDSRYTFALPKTGSDRRGGLNAASDIAKRLY